MKLLELSKRPGYEEIASLAEQWSRVASRQKERENKVPLPNYYLIADDGFDFDELFNAMAEFLEKNELMEFNGESKVYRFFLKYSQPDDPRFESFRMLYEAVEHELTKFGHPYGGILLVDITEWVENKATKQRKFIDFLSYMDAIDERTLILFLDRSGADEASAKAYQELDVSTRLERLTMTYRDPDAGLAELEKQLAPYGFDIEEGFRKEIRKTIELMLNAQGSAGVDSIRQMAEDMVYNALKGEKDFGRTLTKETSAEFLPDGEWTKVFQRKLGSRRLGLVGEGE